MKTRIYYGIILTSLLLSSCFSGSGYRRISKLKLVSHQATSENAIFINNNNFFQLRIFEEKIHYVDNDGTYTNTEFLNYTQATSFQDDISNKKREVAEEKYLYLDNIDKSSDNSKLEGIAIYMETYPIIKNKFYLNTYREKYFNNPNKIYTNILKTCYVGRWSKNVSDNEYTITFQTFKSAMFRKRRGKKIFKLKGSYVLSKESERGFVSINSISHPAIFTKKIDNSAIENTELIPMDSIISLSKISDEVLKTKYRISPDNDLKPGLLFFNTPLTKKITVSNEDEMIFYNYKLNNVIKYFIIRDDLLFFSNDIETYLHTNTHVYK